jgi:ribosomal protein S18 acetylase RimI-like enzyme
MKLRKLLKDDIDRVFDLGFQEFNGELWFTKKFLKETINTPGYYLVAVENKKIIGVIFVRKFDLPKLWIFFFVVDKDYRRQGIGGRLLKAVERKCSNDYPLMFVDIENKNIEAKKFYLRNGFTEQACIKDWFGVDKEGIILSKICFID